MARCAVVAAGSCVHHAVACIICSAAALWLGEVSSGIKSGCASRWVAVDAATNVTLGCEFNQHCTHTARCVCQCLCVGRGWGG